MTDNSRALDIAAREMALYETAFCRDKLTSVLSLWALASKVLGVNLKQGADFVEKQIAGRQVTVYKGLSSEDTGLWEPHRKAGEGLMDMWNSAQDHRWSMPEIEAQGWGEYLRIAPADASNILAEATRIADAVPDGRANGPLQLNSTIDANAARWPWGTHTTQLLDHLAAAAERFWVNYDPSDATTAPTNSQVTTWLKSQGVAERTAEVMATILRIDGLPTGPRK